MISGLFLRRIDIERQLAVLVKVGVGIVVPIIVTIACMRYAPRLLPFVGRRASSKLLRVQDRGFTTALKPEPSQPVR